MRCRRHVELLLAWILSTVLAWTLATVVASADALWHRGFGRRWTGALGWVGQVGVGVAGQGAVDHHDGAGDGGEDDAGDDGEPGDVGRHLGHAFEDGVGIAVAWELLHQVGQGVALDVDVDAEVDLEQTEQGGVKAPGAAHTEVKILGRARGGGPPTPGGGGWARPAWWPGSCPRWPSPR